MRHGKHKHILGVKTAHRSALMANLCSSLLEHGRIKTTLAKAKALRPFAEKIITLAKKAKNSENPAQALHYRRLAIARVRNKAVIKILFDEKVEEFLNREGGYTRIYKLGARRGDAAETAIIELIDGDDEGYQKKKSSKKKAKKAEPKKEEAKEEASEKAAEEPEAEKEAEEVAEVAESTEK